MNRRAGRRDVDGILLLDKPAGPSSNQALQRVKGILAARKAGHAGTLDPLATGLLPILLGEATKFAGALAESEKVYETTVWFGVTTTTGDLGGEVIERRPVELQAQSIRQVADRFRGTINQVPPMHSALKVGGRPLYERARRGETIERASRVVHIAELSIDALRADECDLTVRCSKGTYIRTLAEDMGRVLGCGATVKRLRRTKVGPFGLDCSVSIAELESRGVSWRELLLPMDAALEDLPAIWLSPSAAAQVLQGQSVSVEAAPAAVARLYECSSQRFLGVGRVTQGVLQARRLVAARAAADAVVVPEIA